MHINIAPSEPINIRVLAIPGDPFSLDISWDLPTNPNGIITHYNLYCLEYNDELGSGDDTWIKPSMESNNETVNSSFSSTIMTGLVPFTDYSCYVSANTSVGEGPASVMVTGTTDEYSKLIMS